MPILLTFFAASAFAQTTPTAVTVNTTHAASSATLTSNSTLSLAPGLYGGQTTALTVCATAGPWAATWTNARGNTDPPCNSRRVRDL